MTGRRVFAIILAAGRSARMGRLKQLMPYGDSTMLDAVVDAVMESPIDGLVLVANPEVAPYYEEHLPDRCYLVINDKPDSEMIESVQLGLKRILRDCTPAPADGVMILLADQPQIRPGIIATCAESYRLPRNPPGILIATYQSKRGHPAIFSVARIHEILDWGPQRRLNELAALHPADCRELPITTSPMPIDVNTPEDYERLRSGNSPPFGSIRRSQ